MYIFSRFFVLVALVCMGKVYVLLFRNFIDEVKFPG